MNVGKPETAVIVTIYYVGCFIVFFLFSFFFFQDFKLESTTVEYGGQTLKGTVEARLTADTQLKTDTSILAVFKLD